MWKYLCESLEGTSHKQAGIGCQDSSLASPYSSEDDVALILVCSDGAGSAQHAEIGSKLACKKALEQVTTFFDSGGRVEKLDDSILRSWVNSVHTSLDVEAASLSVPARELACTLLLSVVGRSTSAFLQIGDGAIVTLDQEQYRPVFWPQSGEYQNTTFFITDSEFDQRVQLQVKNQTVDEMAMFSDGLQLLALDYTTRGAHQPFFGDLFRSLRVSACTSDLVVPMRQFLDSKAVNDRTDDDKTLILATRVKSAEPIV